MNQEWIRNGSRLQKWVQISRNGLGMDQKWVQIQKEDPNFQKWIQFSRNGSEMGPNTQRNESETNQKQIQIIRNGSRKSVYHCWYVRSWRYYVWSTVYI